MVFIEVQKTRSGRGRTGEAAAFTLTKKGNGSLRLNAGAMEFLKGRGKNWAVGDTVRIFHDPDTGRVGIKKTPDGSFRLATNAAGSNSLRNSSKDLNELLKKPTGYEVEQSDQYDMVLVPKQ